MTEAQVRVWEAFQITSFHSRVYHFKCRNESREKCQGSPAQNTAAMHVITCTTRYMIHMGKTRTPETQIQQGQMLVLHSKLAHSPWLWLLVSSSQSASVFFQFLHYTKQAYDHLLHSYQKASVLCLSDIPDSAGHIQTPNPLGRLALESKIHVRPQPCTL